MSQIKADGELQPKLQCSAKLLQSRCRLLFFLDTRIKQLFNRTKNESNVMKTNME